MNSYYAKRQLKYWLEQEKEVEAWFRGVSKLIEEGVATGKFSNYLDGTSYFQGYLETAERTKQKIQERIKYYKEKLS